MTLFRYHAAELRDFAIAMVGDNAFGTVARAAGELLFSHLRGIEPGDVVIELVDNHGIDEAGCRVWQEGYCDECGGYDCTDPGCQLDRMVETPEACGDPSHSIHQHADGLWWFPENRDDYATPKPPIVERGPFASQSEAAVAANAYLVELLGPPPYSQVVRTFAKLPPEAAELVIGSLVQRRLPFPDGSRSVAIGRVVEVRAASSLPWVVEWPDGTRTGYARNELTKLSDDEARAQADAAQASADAWSGR